MTNELEKKFYNWLMLNYCVPIKPEKIAHDLAKIAGKEINKLLKMMEVWEATNEALIKLDKESRAENIKLKQQLSEIKYLSRNNVKEIMSKYTKPDMLQWTHQIDKTKPVASCFYSTEDYKNCIEEICQLIPEEGEVIAEGKILACPWLKYDIGDIRIDVRFRKRKNKINKILRDLVKKNKKVQIIIREVKQ